MNLNRGLLQIDCLTFKVSSIWNLVQFFCQLLRFFCFYFQSRVHQLEPIRRERTITCDPATLHNNEAHNYSTQSLNTTEKAKEKLRKYLSEVKMF